MSNPKNKSFWIRMCLTCGRQHSLETIYCDSEECIELGSTVEFVELVIADIPYTTMREMDKRKHRVIGATVERSSYEFNDGTWSEGGRLYEFKSLEQGRD